MMEIIGQDVDADSTFPILEEWLTTSMGKSHFTASVSQSNFNFDCSICFESKLTGTLSLALFIYFNNTNSLIVICTSRLKQNWI